jgi:hypothetical protein
MVEISPIFHGFDGIGRGEKSFKWICLILCLQMPLFETTMAEIVA